MRVAERALEARRRSVVYWMEASRVLAALDRHHIGAIVLKGAALARTVYPAPEQRVSADLDLLVPEDAVEDAYAALARLGYRFADTGRHLSFYEDHHFHYVLGHPSGSVVEVHWDLSRPGDYARFDLAGFRDRSRSIELDGIPIRVPSHADQLLHASCQALRDGFHDLRRVLDGALLLRAGVGCIESLARTARRQGMATPLWLMLELQRELMHIEPPPELHDAVRPRRIVHRCLESLDVPSALAHAGGERDGRLKRLLLWLSAPRLSRSLAEVGRFLLPGRAEYLDDGCAPDRLPGTARRAGRALRRGASLAAILWRQAGCLLQGPAFPRPLA